MATTAALPDVLRSYLMSCSPEHAAQIIQTLRDSQHGNAETEAPNAASSMKAKAGTTAKETGKKQHNKKAKRDGATGGPKRPLNSWMAFRKFYSASLAPHTQKSISKILTMFWREDLFEAKWAMLAKAYSVLRGSREKEDAPLDGFFRLCATKIGVIPPEQYQQTMGWQLGPPKPDDQDKMPQIARTFVPSVDSFPEQFATTTLSVNDLVEHCMSKGYVKTSNIDASNTSAQGALTMAVQTSAAVTTYTLAPPALAVRTGSQMTVNEIGSIATPLSPFSRDLARSLQAELAGEPTDPAGKTVLTDATAAVSNAGAYPYNNLFDPTGQFDVSFNPTDENVNLEDGGMWDAYDPAANMAVDEMFSIDWSQFIHDDGQS